MPSWISATSGASGWGAGAPADVRGAGAPADVRGAGAPVDVSGAGAPVDVSGADEGATELEFLCFLPPAMSQEMVRMKA